MNHPARVCTGHKIPGKRTGAAKWVGGAQGGRGADPVTSAFCPSSIKSVKAVKRDGCGCTCVRACI